MTSTQQRSKLLQSMTSQELVELSQLEHDTLLNKLNSSKISLPSQVQIYGLQFNLTSPELCLQGYSSLSSTLKITQLSPHTFSLLNSLMGNEWFKPFRRSYIKKWELPPGLDMITMLIPRGSFPHHLRPQLNLVWV